MFPILFVSNVCFQSTYYRFKSCFSITNRILNKDGSLETSGFLIIFDRTPENTNFSSRISQNNWLKLERPLYDLTQPNRILSKRNIFDWSFINGKCGNSKMNLCSCEILDSKSRL